MLRRGQAQPRCSCCCRCSCWPAWKLQERQVSDEVDVLGALGLSSACCSTLLRVAGSLLCSLILSSEYMPCCCAECLPGYGLRMGTCVKCPNYSASPGGTSTCVKCARPLQRSNALRTACGELAATCWAAVVLPVAWCGVTERDERPGCRGASGHASLPDSEPGCSCCSSSIAQSACLAPPAHHRDPAQVGVFIAWRD